MIAERILGWVGDDHPAARPGKLWTLQAIVLMAIAAGSLWRLPIVASGAAVAEDGLPWLAPLLAVVLALHLRRTWPRAVARLGAVLLVANCAQRFPSTGNHAYLAAIAFLFLAFLDLRRADDQDIALKALRWLLLLVLFQSGLQKALFGLYTRGQFLAYRISVDPSFAAVLTRVMPRAEAERLRVDAAAGAAATFHFEWWPMVAVSNLVVVLELVLPVLLVNRRTRPAAIVATVALLLAIESAALELTFMVLFLGFLTLFAERDHGRLLVPATAALLTLLLAVRFVFAPALGFG